MANNLKNLDMQQVIRSVYDDVDNSLRVNATFSGTVEVALDHTTDSVLIYGNDGTTDRKIKTDASGNVQVNVLSSTLPSGAATEATLSAINGKLVSGTDIGDVTINNAAGASAVNIQDGGNSITIDGTVSSAPVAGAITNRSATVTATSAIVVPANATRKYLLIQNLGSNVVWIDFNTTAVAASPSIRLQSSDIYIMEGSFISNDAIHARTTSGSSTVVIKEG